MSNPLFTAEAERPEGLQRSHSYSSASKDRLNIQLELASILFVETRSELRSSQRLVLEVVGRPVLAVGAYHEVCGLPADNNCCLVIVDLEPSEHEALKVAKYARRAWPGARILLLGKPSEEFDDPLYDAALTRVWNPQDIVEAVRRLLGDLRGE
jgi:hypothetical protein